MKLDNKTYDVLKWIATIVLPALGTLYFSGDVRRAVDAVLPAPGGEKG